MMVETDRKSSDDQGSPSAVHEAAGRAEAQVSRSTKMLDWQPVQARSPAGERVAALTGESPESTAAWEGVREKAGHYIQEQGRGAERANMAQLEQQGERVTDLNVFTQSFPLLDVATDKRLQSVKIKSVEKDIDDGAANAYRYDFEKLLDPQQAERAADGLLKNREQLLAAGSWPKDLDPTATRADVAGYISQRAELAVPDNHVGKVQDSIRQTATTVPERYNLDAASPEYDGDFTRLVDRVKPIGVTTEEIRAMQVKLK